MENSVNNSILKCDKKIFNEESNPHYIFQSKKAQFKKSLAFKIKIFKKYSQIKNGPPLYLISSAFVRTTFDIPWFNQNYYYDETEDLIETSIDNVNAYKRLLCVEEDFSKDWVHFYYENKSMYYELVPIFAEKLNSLGDKYAKKLADSLIKADLNLKKITNIKLSPVDMELERLNFKIKQDYFQLANNNGYSVQLEYEYDSKIHSTVFKRNIFSKRMMELLYGSVEYGKFILIQEGLFIPFYPKNNYYEHMADLLNHLLIRKSENNSFDDTRESITFQLVTFDGLSLLVDVFASINYSPGEQIWKIFVTYVIEIDKKIIEKVKKFRENNSFITERNKFNRIKHYIVNENRLNGRIFETEKIE